MQTITDNVFIETYTGVVVGVISTPKGLICIDAPFMLEEIRAWRGALMRLPGGNERIVIALDMNPDRMLGIRNMEAPLIAHQIAQEELDSRSITYKADGKYGLYVEQEPLSGSNRWPQVDISFDEHMSLHWGEHPVLLAYYPGVRPDAIWTILPDERVIFLGDAVTHREPPFLADANIPLWLETLNRLLSDDYKRYTLISGRDGIITRREVRTQINRLEKIETALQELGAQNAPAEAVQALAAKFLKPYPAANESQEKLFQTRMQYGLTRYYLRHCQSND